MLTLHINFLESISLGSLDSLQDLLQDKVAVHFVWWRFNEDVQDCTLAL
jgi:hypothetical protein